MADMTVKTMEELLVGSFIRYPETLVDVLGIVSPRDILSLELRQVYLEAEELFRGGKQVDLMAVVHKIGPGKCRPGYLSELEDIGSKVSCRYYAGEVAKAARDRRIAEAMKCALKTLSAEGGEAALSEVTQIIASELKIDKKDPRIPEVLSRFQKIQKEYRANGSMGISTGIPCFDQNYIQYVPGHVWVIGAFTSVGKTAFSIQQRESAAPHRGMFISTEMTEEQLVSRIIANRTTIPSTLVLSGNLHPAQDEQVEREKARLSGEYLRIYDDIYHIDDIENAIIKASMQGGIDVVWIDYVQNIISDEKNEYHSLSRIAKRLQALAKKTRCCLILLSQLSNEAAADDSGLLRFKGAGEFSAIADVALILTRGKGGFDDLEMTIRKNRHGRLGKQLFRFMHNFSSLVPYTMGGES